MLRNYVFMLVCGALFCAGCSDNEVPAFVDKISGMTNSGETENGSSSENDPSGSNTSVEARFDEFSERLGHAKTCEREVGQTLFCGDSLVFDYDQHFVRMGGGVKVFDDQGDLLADAIEGRFSASNEVETVEAVGGVTVNSEGRIAEAIKVLYDYAEGTVLLEGRAVVSDGENRLSGERIRFWSRGSRRMECEPNALLVMEGELGSEESDESANQKFDTEIRANKVVFDEERHRIDMIGNVRVRDVRAAMNCSEVTLFLKEDNKLDWIEARGEVIIRFEDRKALAGLATYDADEGKFTLKEEPMVKQGRNVMTGDRIVFWHETRRMVCEPHARVLLYLDEESKAKFMKDLND